MLCCGCSHILPNNQRCWCQLDRNCNHHASSTSVKVVDNTACSSDIRPLWTLTLAANRYNFIAKLETFRSVENAIITNSICIWRSRCIINYSSWTNMCRCLRDTSFSCFVQLRLMTDGQTDGRPTVALRLHSNTKYSDGHVTCYPLVSHVEHVPSTLLRLQKDVTDGRTDGRPTHARHDGTC